MRGVGHTDAIESVTFKHAEGNEGEKIAVERRNPAFFGGKLLKRLGQSDLPARPATLLAANRWRRARRWSIYPV